MRPLPSLAAAAALAAALPAQWLQITPTVSPSLRRAGAMAYDGANNRLLLYGGVSPSPGTILNETWAYNGQWSLLSPAGGPVGRWGHQMVRNTATNRLITFGGRSPTISGFASDTYEFSGAGNGVWTTVPTPTSPSPRYLYGLAYDQNRSVVVLFGGRSASQTLGDTWEYNGVTWTEVQTAVAPPPREEMVMAYDSGLDCTVLYGGYDRDTDTVLGDTWTYRGGQWLQVDADPGPGPRYRAAGVFDSYRQRVVMYGGFDGTQIVRETYEFTGDAWNQIASANVPPNATEVYAGYDPGTTRRKFVVFGGFGGTFSNQTWEFTGVTTGMFGTFGEACPTEVGLPTLTATPPRLGQTCTFTFGNLPLDTELVVPLVGFSNRQWLGVPLPIDLGIVLGLPGCTLHVAIDLTDFVFTSGGTATWSALVPNQTTLLNSTFYVQGLLLDFVDPDLLWTAATAGGRGVIGNQ